MQSTQRKSSVRTKKSKLRGKGDYSIEVSGEPKQLVRLEKKIDHLERSLVHSTPTKAKAASTIGRTLGNFLNQGDLGALAGESLAKLFGHGDYTVKSNSLMSAMTSPGLPKFDSGVRHIRVTEREYIGDVSSGDLLSGSSVFTNTSYPINPTNRVTFPWLSLFSPLYDQWEPHGIVFEYVSTSSEYNGTSQALGTVIMATDYDVYDQLYTSKQQAENSDFACSTKPSLSLLHGIECATGERPTKVLYTDTNTANPGTMTTLGNFQLSTQGCSTAGVKLGELWVSYDISFYKKQLSEPSTLLNRYNATGTTTALGPMFGNVLSTFSNVGITRSVIVGTGVKFAFPPAQGTGRYLLTIYYSVAAEVPATFNCTNCFIVQDINGDPLQNVLFDVTSPGAFFVGEMALANANWTLNLLSVPTTTAL